LGVVSCRQRWRHLSSLAKGLLGLACMTKPDPLQF
jgi:hypothetical protein